LRTWCRDKDLNYLWPKLWLPHELPTARILTFGYNANFSATKERSSSNIGDFAADLLFRMRYSEKTSERLGQVPIVVVAHSMGGLVFKKAFIQGHLSTEFGEIMSMIKAVLFLATPHRGTDLAGTLNKLLSSSVFGHSPKEYVMELAKRSPTINELNEAFRSHAPKLQIFSFYETLATAMRPISVMILDKSTSVMSYPNETSTPLNADHHNVCKFTSTNDPNYIAIVGALRNISNSLTSLPDGESTSDEDLRVIQSFLEVAAAPEEDLAFGYRARKQGACRWFMESEEVEAWLHATSGDVLWAHGQPGNGKSTVSTFVIEYLLEAGYHCSYFFFKSGQRRKKSPADMLLSLAYQTALRVPKFRRELAKLARSGVKVSNSDWTTMWEKLYSNHLANIKTEDVVYWVIDGVDESESSTQVVEFLCGVANFNTPIRILMLSRELPSIHRAFQQAKNELRIIEMALPDNSRDIRSMVAEEICYLASADDLKHEIIDEITKRAHGNFLWASLVTREVVKCHRHDQVKRVLNSTPDGMDQVYDRMMDIVEGLEASEDKILARILLTWATHAKNPITVEELSEAYPTELQPILDLSHTISRVCGQFVVVNPQGRVTLVHHSAREYLKKTKRRPFSLEPELANEELYGKCIVTLCDKGLRRNISTLKVPLLLPYASTSWAAHLGACSPESNRVLNALVRFFGGSSQLAWIQYLAMSGRLSELFVVSAKLTTYIGKRKQIEADRSSLLQPLSDLSMLESWVVDLTKLASRFGPYLSEDPTSIYKCIPALSPASSVIHQKFSKAPATSSSVSGLSRNDWDDSLVRVSGGEGRALRLAVSPLYLAVASDMPRGTVTIWDTNIFNEVKSIGMGKHVWCLTFNKSGSLLLCYTISQTFIWRTGDWSLQLSASNPHDERAIEVEWDENDIPFMVSEQRRVYRLEGLKWEQLDPTLLEEPDVPEGTFLGTPSCVAFNADCTQIVVAYRSFPLSVWDVDPPRMTARLTKRVRQGQGTANSFTGDNKVVWHPSGAEIFGIRGQVFKWSPIEDTYDYVKGDIGSIPHGISVSPSGQVFITMDVRGSVKIYDVSSMLPIYHLNSEDRISQILFSPDTVRFYDLRGSYCNVWEPECLRRLSEMTSEQVSNAEGTSKDSFWSDRETAISTPISFLTSERYAESKPAVTFVEPGRNTDDLIAYAKGDYTLNVYDSSSNRRHEIVKNMVKLQPEYLAWSRAHDHLAYSLSYGAATVLSVSVSNGAERAVLTEAVCTEKKPKDGGRIQQLLFDSTGTRLLVCRVNKSQVLSIPDGAVLAEHCTPDGEAAKWQRHPSETEYLIRISSLEIAIFCWNNLEQKNIFTIRATDLSPKPDMQKSNDAIAKSINDNNTNFDALSVNEISPTTLDAILDSHDPRVLLLRIVTMYLNRPRYSFIVLPTAQIHAAASTRNSTTGDRTIKPIAIPPSLASVVAHAVGILPDGRLVFLDNRLWVCTGALPLSPDTASARDILRHFFIPRDWVTTKDLRLCRLLRDGTLLCPSKGEVAVMRGDLVVEW